MATIATPARRGRPRVEGLDQALLDVTLELAGEVGLNGMSMDDLAQRAGVSKATIYRRWPSKERLVLEALNQAMRPFDVIDTDGSGDVDEKELYSGLLLIHLKLGEHPIH